MFGSKSCAVLTTDQGACGWAGSSSAASTDSPDTDDDDDVLTITRSRLSEKGATRMIWEHASSRLGLLTSALDGSNNVLAVEWISHVQFSPPLLMVSLVDGYHSASLVQQSGQFGLCFASDRQRELISTVGTVSGASSDKFANNPALQPVGTNTTVNATSTPGLYRPGASISAPMLLGGVMSCECIVRKTLHLDTSTIYVGEVVYAKVWKNRMPLGYHRGATFHYGDVLEHRPEGD